MANVHVKTKTISSANVIEVSAGTNCPQGGDAGHGGVTYFRMKDIGATAISIKVNGRLIDEEVREIEVIMRGDTESETFSEALKFAAQVIEVATSEVHAGVRHDTKSI